MKLSVFERPDGEIAVIVETRLALLKSEHRLLEAFVSEALPLKGINYQDFPTYQKEEDWIVQKLENNIGFPDEEKTTFKYFKVYKA